jgi:hypothetical protein
MILPNSEIQNEKIRNEVILEVSIARTKGGWAKQQ